MSKESNSWEEHQHCVATTSSEQKKCNHVKAKSYVIVLSVFYSADYCSIPSLLSIPLNSASGIDPIFYTSAVYRIVF